MANGDAIINDKHKTIFSCRLGSWQRPPSAGLHQGGPPLSCAAHVDRGSGLGGFWCERQTGLPIIEPSVSAFMTRNCPPYVRLTIHNHYTILFCGRREDESTSYAPTPLPAPRSLSRLPTPARQTQPLSLKLVLNLVTFPSLMGTSTTALASSSPSIHGGRAWARARLDGCLGGTD